MAAPHPRARSSRARLLVLLAVVVLAGWWQLRERDRVDSGPRPSPPVASTSPTPTEPTTAPSGARPSSEANPKRRDLQIDEARGGHTLARHVGKTDADLRARLDQEHGISAASSYTDRATAERTVARALERSNDRIDQWVERTGNRPNLALTYRGPRTEILGRSLERGASAATPSTNAVVVLRWARDDFYVLTSYPEAGR